MKFRSDFLSLRANANFLDVDVESVSLKVAEVCDRPASFERLECVVHIHMKLQLIERNTRCIARLVFINSMVLLVSFLNLATTDQT